MRSLGRVAILTAAISIGIGSADAQTPEELFDRGNAAYESGRYDEAAEAYRGVLRYGIEDARVEYNLGNAAFKLRRTGESILHYERALKLDPGDPDTRANLALARSLCVDRVETEDVAPFVRAVVEGQNRLGADRQAVGVLVVVWMMAAIVAWCGARPGGFGAWAGWSLAILGVAAAILVSSWYVTTGRLDGDGRAVVMAEAVEVLAGPSENNALLFTVHEGLTLRIQTERQEWVQVSLPNGLNGWVPRDAIERV